MLFSDKQIDRLLQICGEAASHAMRYYRASFRIDLKIDGSPVTIADIEISQYLEKALREVADWPVLSEEHLPTHPDWLGWPTYWLIDPIDGTKGFINQTDDFCICIALIHHHQPVLGLISSPTEGVSWYADNRRGAMQYSNGKLQNIHSLSGGKPWTVAISADNPSQKMQVLLEVLEDYQCYRRSSALKFVDCLTGRAALYPKLWDTSEWDSAAGQCLLESVGGQVLDFATGKALRYGQNTSLINPHFLAHGGVEADRVAALLAQYQSIFR